MKGLIYREWTLNGDAALLYHPPSRCANLEKRRDDEQITGERC